jgi:hypothetical protein
MNHGFFYERQMVDRTQRDLEGPLLRILEQ